MDGPIEISSMALVLIGDEPITSFATSEGKRAKVAKALYEPMRDAVLREFAWNFAVTQKTLAVEASTPLFGYGYQYALPTDPYCLRALKIDTEDAEWRIMGRKLHTDEGSVILEYIARVQDWTQYDAMFIDCLAAKLAACFALPLTGNAEYVRAMELLYEDRLGRAKGINGREGVKTSPNPFAEVR